MPSKADYAKIHIAKQELGLDDETYRDVLKWKFNVSSSKDLKPRQVIVLLNHFKARGWKPKAARKAKPQQSRSKMASDPQSKKIRALWITMHQEGLVKNPSETALARYIKRMTGVDRLEWCTSAQKHRLIEALKKWHERD